MITDWDDAYANRDHVADADNIIAQWSVDAKQYRSEVLAAGRAQTDLAYGKGPRHTFDLFLPEGESHGLVVFIHGGYWRAFDKSSFSHLAIGAVARGWAVAIPSYTLCPQVRISQITAEIAFAVEYASALISGPVVLSGHSAGGHLAARMACTDAALSSDVRARIERVMSISGVHDLRPLLRTELNQTLKLDQVEAEIESPALLRPVQGLPVSCWVGAEERPEFVRQNALLANIWLGMGADTSCHEITGKHHFDVIEALRDPQSEMVCWLVGQ